MFCDFTCDEEFGVPVLNPARQKLVACGYDKHCYISTAKLAPYPYTTQDLIQAALGGAIKLIESCDDQSPPLGSMEGDVLAVFNSVVQNVTTEINGYLSTIYPCPLAQTGTVCVLKVTTVDDSGGLTALEIVSGGNYATAPATPNSPAYLHHSDESLDCQFFDGCNQLGSGASLNLTLSDSPFSDESGQAVTAKTVSAASIAAGGVDYAVNDILVVVGGSSFVPAKVRQFALDLVCHSLYKRRLSPDEKNPFSAQAKTARDKLADIGCGECELDGTYRRSFSAGAAWVTRSVFGGANSL